MAELFFIVPFLVALVLYVGLFTGHTQSIFSPTNDNDALVSVVCRALEDTPDHWRWDGYSATHPDNLYVRPATDWSFTELRVDGRDVELTARQKQRLRRASDTLREGGSASVREQRSDLVAKRLIARLDAEMRKHPSRP